MPDQIDIVIHVPDGAPGLARTANNQMQLLSRAIGTLLSSYAQAYNKQVGRRGSLFQPKTKAIAVRHEIADCFDALHNAPCKSGLVFKAGDWEFSSYLDYYHNRQGICNTDLGRSILN